MLPVEDRAQTLASLLMKQAVREGVTSTALDGVSLIRAENTMPAAPVLQEPMVVIVGQGCKTGQHGQQVLVLDPQHFLMAATPLPFRCETPSSGQPMLALAIRVDPVMVGDLVMRLDCRQPGRGEASAGMYRCPVDNPILDASIRLVECLASPRDCAVLGPERVREVLYRVISSDDGQSLQTLFARHGRLRQIRKAIEHIQQHYRQALFVPQLANAAGMSPSAFHSHFKELTGCTPLQYLKNTRLHKARLLLAHEGLSVSQAAYAVGYASPSQFSREFKRMFGLPPLEEARRLRDSVSAQS
ncbi:AraC family transcriptional regulator [uncultured Aquitalea sp.]|uniref:AraC family transcriptional regulator n=1 Tax=uncultured Aquitalea sp. TaxID=540272 RepID=UPI0025E5004F|nr:AraC family transcriptional regulator [uncultured Aquitalea sp.]